MTMKIPGTGVRAPRYEFKDFPANGIKYGIFGVDARYQSASAAREAALFGRGMWDVRSARGSTGEEGH